MDKSEEVLLETLVYLRREGSFAVFKLESGEEVKVEVIVKDTGNGSIPDNVCVFAINPGRWNLPIDQEDSRFSGVSYTKVPVGNMFERLETCPHATYLGSRADLVGGDCGT